MSEAKSRAIYQQTMPMSWQQACSAHNNVEMLTSNNNCEPAKSKRKHERQMRSKGNLNVSPMIDTTKMVKLELDQQAEKQKA